MIKLIALLSLILLLSGCKDKQNSALKLNAQQWYDKGQLALTNRKGSDAVEAFEKVVQYYPYDTVAADAQLQLVRAHRMDGTHESAIANADAFLQIYPAHKKANEALLLKALSYFDQVTGEREETHAVQSLATFSELRRRDPDYQRDIREKAEQTLFNIVVSSIMQQAKAFVRRKALFPAINKYTEVLKYPRTNFTNEALLRLMECFFTISLDKEAVRCFGLIEKGTFWHQAALKLMQRYAPQSVTSVSEPTGKPDMPPAKKENPSQKQKKG